MWYMRRVLVVTLWIGTVGGVTGAVPTYSGSLTGAAGITGIVGNPWLTSGTVFSWAVTDQGDGTYMYTYRLQVPNDTKEISHIIMEVSPTFEAQDILAVLQGALDGAQPDNYPKAGDVGMPSAMRGIKFTGGAGGTDYDWTMSFVTARDPVWGDFYAINGKKPGEETAIWNRGFGNPDSDPAVAPASGSFDNHILVPDTTVPIIPAPGASILGTLGVGVVKILRRRRTL